MQASFAYISTLRRAFDDRGARFTAEDLESVPPAIARCLVADAIRGWMFTANVVTRPLPYAVTRLDYKPPSNDETGCVFIELKANAKGAIASTTLRISAGDIVGKTVGEIFAVKGFLKGTPELMAAYDETEARYFDWRARYGAQFSGTGMGFYTEDPNSSHRDTDWSRKMSSCLLPAAAAPHSSSMKQGVSQARREILPPQEGQASTGGIQTLFDLPGNGSRRANEPTSHNLNGAESPRLFET